MMFPLLYAMEAVSRIKLGVLGKPHGLEGGIRCNLAVPSQPLITLPCDVMIGFSPSFVNEYSLIRFEQHNENELLCFFAGFTTRDRVRTLTDRALFIDGRFLSYDESITSPELIGFEVIDEQGRNVGKIRNVFRTNAHFVWIVATNSHEWMIPAIEEFVLGIDLEEQRVRVRLIPGLFDIDEAK